MVRLEKSKNPINRVKCVVDSCTYWDSGNHCVANEIEIQPTDAVDTEETDCATFSPKLS